MKRIKTDKPGVFYRVCQRIGGVGKEKIFYVIFKKDGKFRFKLERPDPESKKRFFSFPRMNQILHAMDGSI